MMIVHYLKWSTSGPTVTTRCSLTDVAKREREREREREGEGEGEGGERER